MPFLEGGRWGWGSPAERGDGARAHHSTAQHGRVLRPQRSPGPQCRGARSRCRPSWQSQPSRSWQSAWPASRRWGPGPAERSGWAGREGGRDPSVGSRGEQLGSACGLAACRGWGPGLAKAEGRCRNLQGNEECRAVPHTFDVHPRAFFGAPSPCSGRTRGRTPPAARPAGANHRGMGRGQRGSAAAGVQGPGDQPQLLRWMPACHVSHRESATRLGGVLHNALHGVAHNHGHTLVQGLLGDLGCRRKQRVCRGRLVSRCKQTAGQQATPLPGQRQRWSQQQQQMNRATQVRRQCCAPGKHRKSRQLSRRGRTGLEELLGGALHHILAKLDQSLQVGTANGTNAGLGEAAVGGLRRCLKRGAAALRPAHACWAATQQARWKHSSTRAGSTWQPDPNQAQAQAVCPPRRWPCPPAGTSCPRRCQSPQSEWVV